MSARCERCGAPLIWARHVHPDGRVARMPLDARPQAKIYRVHPDGTCEPADGYHVTHFATCPFAREFSRRGRAPNTKEVPDA